MKKQFIMSKAGTSSFEKFVPAPYFRKSFNIDFIPDSAEFKICGLGFFRLFINGKEITKGALAPYISNPDHYCYYHTYDLLPFLTTGKNVIGVLLGNGFMNPFGGSVWDFHLVDWLGAPRMALEFSAKNKETELSFIADESFKTHASPILFDEYRIGEHYDANIAEELDGWSSPNYDDSDWDSAIIAERPRGELVPAKAEPIVTLREVAPVEIKKVGENSYLYDFGINSAGVCRLSIDANKGQTITMDHCERLLDGNFDKKNIIFSPTNYPFYDTLAYKTIYTASGKGREVWTPSFVYFGFRYVLIEGIDEGQATKDLLTYCVMSSDLKKIGGFSCSDDRVNTIYNMVDNAVRSNFFYFPTDCPHREKNGWTGDASMSSDFTMLMYDTDKSWSTWLDNIRKAQNYRGELPGIVPTGTWGFKWGNGPTWDSVLFNLPYQLYKMRGNTQVIRDNAHAMMRYLDYIMTRRSPDGTIAIGLGDWVPVGKSAGNYDAPLKLTDSVMVMDMARKACEMFGAIGLHHQADFANDIYYDMRRTIRRALIDFDTMTVDGNCQSSQAIALYYGVFDDHEKSKALAKLVDLVHAKDDNFDCGFIGMHCLFYMLTEAGEHELAWHLIMKDSYPSYAHLIDIGETAMVEQFRPDGSSGVSRNHHFLGDVVRWFTYSLAGLKVIDSKTVVISPAFVKALDSASAYYDLPAGRVEVKWERNGERYKLWISCCEGVDCSVKIRRDIRDLVEVIRT